MKEQLEKYKKLFSLMFDDLKTQGNRHKQIPNILTMMRLFAPIIIIPSFVIGNIPFALGSVAAFALTDALDGFIARTFKLTSELGKDLDAVADKLFAATLLISLSTINPIYIFSLTLEAVIGGICSYKKLHRIDIKTCKLGKVKTILLDFFVVMGMGSLLINLSPLLLNMMGITTGIFQILTIKEYIKVRKPIEFAIENLDINKKELLLSEEEDEERTYDKTLKYPHKVCYEQNKEKKLVKTKQKK